jgi:hypothetical protein
MTSSYSGIAFSGLAALEKPGRRERQSANRVNWLIISSSAPASAGFTFILPFSSSNIRSPQILSAIFFASASVRLMDAQQHQKALADGGFHRRRWISTEAEFHFCQHSAHASLLSETPLRARLLLPFRVTSLTPAMAASRFITPLSSSRS